MKALIYKPVKTAMQSGKAKTDKWILEFEAKDKKIVDNLMGWQGSDDMNQEIKLFFDTKEDAISYAHKHEIKFDVIEPKDSKIKLQTYAENFTG